MNIVPINTMVDGGNQIVLAKVAVLEAMSTAMMAQEPNQKGVAMDTVEEFTLAVMLARQFTLAVMLAQQLMLVEDLQFMRVEDTVLEVVDTVLEAVDTVLEVVDTALEAVDTVLVVVVDMVVKANSL